MLFSPLQNTSDPVRVAVTGGGIVSPVALGWQGNAARFREVISAFRPVSLFDVHRQRVQNAAEVDLPMSLPRTRLERRQAMRLDRASRMLLLAALEAWDQAGWDRSEPVPIVLGTTSGGMSLGEAYLLQAIERPRSVRYQPTRAVNYLCQRQALNLCSALGIEGPITIIANACASGANAIGHAWALVRSGMCRRALAGGYDALNQLVFAGFDSLQALSPTRCRPFDAGRDGLALGEGAAVLALESLGEAGRRHSPVLAEVAGYGAATDLHHLTQPHPEGHAAFAAMQRACKPAGVTPDQVDYVNAHGTGTVFNDAAEAAAINRWAGEAAAELYVSSIKGSIGHLLGAAGAVEAAITVMALQGGFVPPTASVERVDPAGAFQLVTAPLQKELRWALSNSFGFGGANASLLFRRAS